jgi:putative ABC transport system permease protein
MNALPFGEFRLAIRRLRKDAAATIAAVAALACAIGAAVATWSLLSSVLLKPLPVAEPERLFLVDKVPPPNVAPVWVPAHSNPFLEAIRDSGTFEAIAAGGPALRPPLVLEQGDVPQRREVYFAAHDFFATLGISAARGRTFTEQEDRRGAPVVAVISDRYWRRVFNADPDVVGRTVTFTGTSATVATIIGVLPRGFRGLHLSEAPDLYLPLHVVADVDHDLARFADPLVYNSWIRIVGRLRAGETTEEVAAHLNALDCLCPRGVTQGEVSPLSLTNVNTAAVPQVARAGAEQFTTLLSITVGLLLLVGCLTVGMLLLVRTEDRRDELAIRLALGATRARLASSIAVEAVILCALGAVLAVPIAFWLFYGIRNFEIPGRIDVAGLELTLDTGTWLAVTGVTIAVTCFIGMLASFVGAAIRSPIQSRAFATPRVTRRAPRTVLIAGQVAITVVLVTGAGLFTRSLIEALSLNAAFETHRIVAANIELGQYGYTRERAATFIDDLLLSLRQNGVMEAVGISQGAGSSQAGTLVAIDGAARELPSGLEYVFVDQGFFAAFGLPVVVGRNFEPSEAAGLEVVLVSESLGRFIADGGDPLGHRISEWESSFRLNRGQAPLYSPEIVGVVPDFVTNVSSTEPLAVYHPLGRPVTVGLAATTLYLRAAGDPRAAIREAGAAVKALDPRVTLLEIMTLDDRLGRQMNPQRFGVYVLGALGGIALLLTVLGTYVIAQSMVVRRRRELGIRAALGAQSAQLRRLVLGDTARLVGIGLVAGLALAAAGARLIRSLLYQVEPLDPLTLVTTAAVIFGLALLVSLRPALEATRVDLNRTLREE